MKFKKLIDEIGALTTPTTSQAKLIISKMREKIKAYVVDNNIKSLVVGVSGGLDSACVAALCQEKYTGVPLIGLSIPMSSTNAHKEQAKWVGDNFCTVFEEFTGWDEKFFESNEAEAYDVSSTIHTKVFNVLEQTNVLAEKAGFKTESFPASILDGNLKARLRMITLYDLARKTNGLVLSTDNLSEFQMGFWTICGDVGDYAPLQNIGKGFELPAIARQLDIRNDIIVQAPSDGLMITDDDTDEAQLGANYQEVDTIMYCYKNDNPYFKRRLFETVGTDTVAAQKVAKVIGRYESGPVVYKRNGTIKLQRDVIGLQ